ncbi:MAG: CHASE2 domain-containing protein [Magnetococcales bacterium]|nr:CHASE2 domain-containing protein [Magnetococcales bacterium]
MRSGAAAGDRGGRGRWPSLSSGFSLLVLMVLLAGQLFNPAPRQAIRNSAFDRMQQFVPRAYTEELPLRVVAIDEASLKAVGQWPWPRMRIAELVDHLHQMGAAVVVLNLLLVEPDRTSPAGLAALWPDHPEWTATLKSMPDHDQILAEALARSPTVIGFTLENLTEVSRLPLEKAKFITVGEDTREVFAAFTGGLASLPLFEHAASGNGAITQEQSDDDGVLRRQTLIYRVGNGLYPVLGLEALRVYEGTENLQLDARQGVEHLNPGLAGIVFGKALHYTSPRGEIWLYYRPLNLGRYLSAKDVLHGVVDPVLIKDHIVFVGTTSEGMGDRVFTPLGEVIPGVELHVQLVEQLILGDYLLRFGWESPIVVGLLVMAWLFSRVLRRHSRVLPLLILNTLLACGILILASYLFVEKHLLFDPIYPILSMVVLLMSVIIPNLFVAEKERHLVQAKSAFIANVSHELRTPLNAILGLTELCLRTGMTARQRDYLDKVKVASKSLLGLINDLLDMSKMEAGRLTLESIPLDLDRVLENVATVTEVKAQEKGVPLTFRRQPEIPANLMGDPNRLGQILINLVNNAVKFTESGEVETFIRLQSLRGDRVILECSVRDSGIGMTESEKRRLFQAFSQADPSITRRYGGTGLGLAICKQLVDGMGGRIWVESEPGKGSTFFFTVEMSLGVAGDGSCFLPPAGAVREGKASPGADLAALRGARVLLVEDNAFNQEVATGLLRHVGVVVDCAWNGQEAIDKLEDGVYDAILMDVQMPVMDGFTATRKIRADRRFARHPPILAMTANAQAGSRAQAHEAGMDGFVSKPIDPERLYAALGEWIVCRPPEESVFSRVETGGSPPPLPGQPVDALPFPDLGELPAHLPGVSLEAALAHVGGNRALLGRLLVLFLQEHAGDGERLVGALDRGDRVLAHRMAHSMKGIAGSLGAILLQQAAERLDSAFKDGELGRLRELALDLTLELEPIVAGLSSWAGSRPVPLISPTSPPVGGVSDPEMVTPLFQELERLLMERDPDAEESTEALARHLDQGECAPLVAILRNQVRAFDFDEARETLASLRQRLKPQGPEDGQV